MNKAPIKAIKKETASLLASLFFIALEVGILRMPANERRSREIGAYTIDLLSQDNVVSKRKIPVELRFYGFSVAWKYIKGRKRITNSIEKRLPGECPDNRL